MRVTVGLLTCALRSSGRSSVRLTCSGPGLTFLTPSPAEPRLQRHQCRCEARRHQGACSASSEHAPGESGGRDGGRDLRRERRSRWGR